MTAFIKGRVRELSQYMGAVANLQEWRSYSERRALVAAMDRLDARAVLAVDDRFRLAGSFLFYPTASDPEFQPLLPQLPCNPADAFTVALVWVHPSQRGTGTGKALWREAMAEAKLSGFKARVGYGHATPEIWSFAGRMNTPQTVEIEGVEFAGNPVRFTPL